MTSTGVTERNKLPSLPGYEASALKKIAYRTGTTIIVGTVAIPRPPMIVTAMETKNSSAAS